MDLVLSRARKPCFIDKCLLHSQRDTFDSIEHGFEIAQSKTDNYGVHNNRKESQDAVARVRIIKEFLDFQGEKRETTEVSI